MHNFGCKQLETQQKICYFMVLVDARNNRSCYQIVMRLIWTYESQAIQLIIIFRVYTFYIMTYDSAMYKATAAVMGLSLNP